MADSNDLYNTAIEITGMSGLAADNEFQYGTSDTSDMYDILCDRMRERGE